MFNESRSILFKLYLSVKKKIFKPIFVSGLPRSGTTLVTSIINQHSEVGSYNYKDLPFHRIPMIWNKLNIESEFQYVCDDPFSYDVQK